MPENALVRSMAHSFGASCPKPVENEPHKTELVHPKTADAGKYHFFQCVDPLW
jgi:hypothetical protein